MSKTQHSRFDDLAALAGSAFEMLGGAQDKIRHLVKTQTDRLVSQMDLVSREEFDALYAMVSKARLVQEKIEARLDRIEKALGVKTVKTVSRTKKPAPAAARRKAPARKMPRKSAR